MLDVKVFLVILNRLIICDQINLSLSYYMMIFNQFCFMRARLMKALEVCGAAVGTAKHQQGLE